MYEIFYNLRAEPFRLSPDHRFCYEHKGYAKARAYMAYAFMRAEGFVMVTGRPGTGKTTLIGDLIESLARDNVTTANLVCTQLQADDLLKTVAYSFGVSAGGVDKAELLQRLNVLFHNWHRDGRRALLIVDEAQDLSITAMEELRLLTNIQVDGQPLLQIFLLGQPELRDLILSPPMEQVHQRIVAASHLEALELEETEAYVRHRLEAVGWQGDPAISKAIFPLIYKFSEGVPRRINLICSRLFLHGGVEQRHEIGVQDVRVVISELQTENLAAGNKFAEADFEVEDEFEQVPMVAQAPVVEIPVEVKLHAVGSEPFTSFENELVSDIEEHVDIPVVAEIAQAHSSDIPAGRIVSASDAAPGGNGEGTAISEGGSSSLAFAQIPPEEQAPEPMLVQKPESGIESGTHSGIDSDLRRPAVKPVEPQARGRGAGAQTIVVILLVTLLILLGVFAARQGGWGDWRSKLQALWGDKAASQTAPAVRETDRQLENEVADLSKAVETKLDEMPREDAPLVDAMASNSGEVQPALGAAVADEFQIVAPLEDELPASDGSVNSTELSTQADEHQPLEETALPAMDQVIYVAFAFDSADISLESQKALDRAVGIMSQSRSSVASVTGFSDSKGEEAYNLVLSRQRADAVEQYLVSEGVEQGRLQVDGRGARYDFTDAEISAASLGNEEYRIVQIRISGGSGIKDT